jgi:hypothetical protein
MTVGTAASLLRSGRYDLRVVNRSSRNVHRQIHFHMPADEASTWREGLIEVLKAASNGRKAHATRAQPPER